MLFRSKEMFEAVQFTDDNIEEIRSFINNKLSATKRPFEDNESNQVTLEKDNDGLFLSQDFNMYLDSFTLRPTDWLAFKIHPRRFLRITDKVMKISNEPL